MDVLHDVLVAACGVLGALGVAALLLPTRQARLRRWLRREDAEQADSAVLAVQAALSRGAVAAVGVFLALALAFLALQLKAVGIALALPLTALLVAFLPVGGGARRSAGLTETAPAGGLGRWFALLAAAGVVIAAGLMWVQAATFAPERLISGLAMDVSIVLPELAVYTLPTAAAVAVAVPLVAGAARLAITRRSGLSGATGPVDALLRRHQARLVVRAGLAAELVLAAVLIRFLPLLTASRTAEVYGSDLTRSAGVLALVLVAAGLAMLVRGATLPVRTKHSAPALAVVR